MIKTWKEFNEAKTDAELDNINSIVKMSRKMADSTIFKGLGRFLSIIDDIIHFDIKSLIHSFKNKKGYNKIEELQGELGLLKGIMKDDEISYEDLLKLDIDVDKVIKLYSDPDVEKYFLTDQKLAYRFTKFNEIIEWLEGFDAWKKDK